jgi:hypothetical protein
LRTAICYSGQFRTLDRCFDNHVDFFINQLCQNDHTVDLFASLHRGEKEREYCETWLQDHNFHKFEILDLQESISEKYSHSQNFGNFELWLKQIHSIKRSFQLVSQDYDLVVRVRTDLLFTDTLEPPDTFLDDCLYVPNHDDWYGYNDRFAIGTYKTMRKYCDLVTSVFEGKTNGTNAESYLMSHLEIENVRVKRTKVKIDRLRANGEVERGRY